MFDTDITDTGTLFCLIAAVIYLSKYSALGRYEKLIAVVIWLNLICDIVCFILGKKEIETGFVYNILLPAERIISLYIYAIAINQNNLKKTFHLGIVAIVIIRLVAIGFESSLLKFQFVANTVEGLLTAILSYLFIRVMIVKKDDISAVLLGFGVANFLYLTLMASAMSALKLAYLIDKDYSLEFYAVNTLAYIIWSLTLVTAILWKKKI